MRNYINNSNKINKIFKNLNFIIKQKIDLSFDINIHFLTRKKFQQVYFLKFLILYISYDNFFKKIFISIFVRKLVESNFYILFMNKIAIYHYYLL